jgi:hypothetical protein
LVAEDSILLTDKLALSVGEKRPRSFTVVYNADSSSMEEIEEDWRSSSTGWIDDD